MFEQYKIHIYTVNNVQCFMEYDSLETNWIHSNGIHSCLMPASNAEQLWNVWLQTKLIKHLQQGYRFHFCRRHYSTCFLNKQKYEFNGCLNALFCL